jgi:hypothetical protein
MLAQAGGWRSAELRKRREIPWDKVGNRMGASVARVSQIEAGDVSTQDVLARYIAALGGTLKLIDYFGDENSSSRDRRALRRAAHPHDYPTT